MNKRFVGGILDYTKKERRGILLLFAAVAALYAAQFIYPLIVKPDVVPAEEVLLAANALDARRPDTSRRSYDRPRRAYIERTANTYRERVPAESFSFDPNTATAQEWTRLGVREKTVAGILKYISKGGRFRTPEDINKIWGISDEDKARLQPLVRIAAVESGGGSPTNQSFTRPAYVPKVIASVDVNSADSAALEALPGIGPGYARRIIKFRNSLGGFHSAAQVKETFGLPDSVYQKIEPYLRLENGIQTKLNINTATNDELKAHPYIRWQLANVICEYRKQHGNFSSLADLRKIMIINAEVFERISPYLTL